MRETIYKYAKKRKLPRYPEPDLRFTMTFARFTPGMHTYYREVIPGVKLRDVGFSRTLLSDEAGLGWRLENSDGLVMARPNSPNELDGIKTLREDHKVVVIDCVTPDTRVLRADLHWVPAGGMLTGDEVVAFDEQPSAPGYRSRRYRRAKMTNHGTKRTTLYGVQLDSGEVLRCTGSHRWLTWGGRRKGDGGELCWVRTDEMAEKLAGSRQVRYRLPRILRPWRQDISYSAGFLAGAFDADGRALERVGVVSVKQIGRGDVVMLQSDSGTYLAEGYPAHNTDDYPELSHQLDPSLASIWDDAHIQAFEDCVREADLITVSNNLLADRMEELGARRTAILDNALDPRSGRWDVEWPKYDGKVRIGWAAGFTHSPDQSILENPVKEVLRRFPKAVFKTMGYMPKWVVDLDPEQFEVAFTGDELTYPQELAGIDIGVGPLMDNEYNVYRSSIKAWELTAAGACFVASNYGPYERDLKHGKTAMLCSTEAEWTDALSALVEDEYLRESLWHKARAELINRSIDHRVLDWYWAYRQAFLDRRKEWDQGPQLWLPHPSTKGSISQSSEQH